MATKKKAASQKPRAAKSSKKGTVKKDVCFIIMPFGDWFDYYYETIYHPAIEAAGLKPRRADDLYRPSAIVHDIWALTQQAKVVLADLSGKNPNVFYELGLAHAIAKPAILVTESMEDVPFDLRALRVLVYDKNQPDWGDKLKSNIESSIKEVLDAPLESVLPTFIKVRESAPSPTATKTEKELISLRQDMDLVKREMQARTKIYVPQASRRINTEDAYHLVREYLSNNTPDRFIVRELVRRGLTDRAAKEIISYVRGLQSAQQSIFGTEESKEGESDES